MKRAETAQFTQSEPQGRISDKKSATEDLGLHDLGRRAPEAIENFRKPVALVPGSGLELDPSPAGILTALLLALPGGSPVELYLHFLVEAIVVIFQNLNHFRSGELRGDRLSLAHQLPQHRP